MLLPFGLRDFNQILLAETRGFRQHRPGDADLVIARQTADHRGRRLRNRRKLNAHFSKSDPGADIGDRPYLDRLDEALQHIAEQLNLLPSKLPADARNRSVTRLM